VEHVIPGHPGESAMKRWLRAKVWWPRIDRDAERTPPFWPQANGEVENMNRSLFTGTIVTLSRIFRSLF